MRNKDFIKKRTIKKTFFLRKGLSYKSVCCFTSRRDDAIAQLFFTDNFPNLIQCHLIEICQNNEWEIISEKSALRALGHCKFKQLQNSLILQRRKSHFPS
jgi:hypothetical protein